MALSQWNPLVLLMYDNKNNKKDYSKVGYDEL
jgi:hypothetical protein